FKPCLNSVAIEAILMTKDDAVCAPGATAGATPLFALFDTSELEIPDFARVGQRPNLAASAPWPDHRDRRCRPLPPDLD
ncbi:hypothetical protein ACC695_40580, partial [Rhizobium ruizarguesonis]